jgi:hypothetical protein
MKILRAQWFQQQPGKFSTVDSLAAASMGFLPKHHWKLLLAASTPSPKTIPEHASFEQVSYVQKTNTLVLYVSNIDSSYEKVQTVAVINSSGRCA